jgi:hypothetical protein
MLLLESNPIEWFCFFFLRRIKTNTAMAVAKTNETTTMVAMAQAGKADEGEALFPLERPVITS